MKGVESCPSVDLRVDSCLKESQTAAEYGRSTRRIYSITTRRQLIFYWYSLVVLCWSVPDADAALTFHFRIFLPTVPLVLSSFFYVPAEQSELSKQNCYDSYNKILVIIKSWWILARRMVFFFCYFTYSKRLQCGGSEMFIPDPTFFHPGSRGILIKEFKYFNPKTSKKMVSKL